MKTWQIQKAKSKLCSLVKSAERGEPQFITRHGARTAVVISNAEYERLSGLKKNAVLQLFKRNAAKGLDFEVKRSKEPAREVDL